MCVLKVKVISLPYMFQDLYVLYFTGPRYQVSVYRTIGPLVYSYFCSTSRHRSRVVIRKPLIEVVLMSTQILCFEQKSEKYPNFIILSAVKFTVF